jgi:hypothetical protein
MYFTRFLRVLLTVPLIFSIAPILSAQTTSPLILEAMDMRW